MKTYRVTLTITQQWDVFVDADCAADAKIRAASAYSDSPNPWEDFESVGEETVVCNSVMEKQ